MGVVGAGKDTEDGDEVVHVYCSICLSAVKCGGDRSTAKLQCGHEFHLDCIGSAFNAKGVMQCPNCRKVEEGNWFYANGSHSTPELTMDEWIQDEDLYNLNYAESDLVTFSTSVCINFFLSHLEVIGFQLVAWQGFHRCLSMLDIIHAIYISVTAFPVFLCKIASGFRESESSPAVSCKSLIFQDALLAGLFVIVIWCNQVKYCGFAVWDLSRYHANFLENQATVSVAHPCPLMAYMPPLQPSSSSNNHSVDSNNSDPGYHHQWSHFPRPRDFQTLYMMAPSNIHYRGWEHCHASYSPIAHINSAESLHFARLATNGLSATDSVFHPFVLSHGTISRVGAPGSSAPSLVPPYLRTHRNGHEHYQLQHSQITHGTVMPHSGSLWSFNPSEQCGPFLVSPTVQTNVDAENITSTRLYAWEHQCFAPHPFFPIDREPSCWGPFLQANSSRVSDSSPPQMVYFPLNSSERPSAQAGHNRSMPPPRMLPLL
ncbi:zinc finger, C3HC4 type, domain containing protein [Musa troglodytarum]|uniref:Zinc finger, C3HC4 type, domain containing protein n=1 Tax=Musa troglodytarum TaxID=320322 RepID=A0A9E7FZ40_9LILI|nr:zinc finger, C3HC4 type, domain containing protein [Musa troglodytarum]